MSTVGIIMTIVAVVIVIIFFFVIYARLGPNSPWRGTGNDEEAQPFASLITLAIAATVALFFYIDQSGFWERVSAIIASRKFELVVLVCALIAVALLLYSLKRNVPKIYAFLEFGTATIAAILALDARDGSWWSESSKIVASIYLYIRAIDNWQSAPRPLPLLPWKWRRYRTSINERETSLPQKRQ